MNTKIINNVIKMKNSFTQAGRFKNQMYNDLYSAGMREIRERTIDKDRFVLMASKTTGKGKSDITFGVDLKKGYIQKQTELSRILTCYDKKLSLVTKFFTDMQGNLLRRITRKQTSVNGKNFADETITEVPDKYTKITKTGNTIKRKVNVEYTNGNKYNFTEDNNGNKIYNRIIDGVEYTFFKNK